MQIKNQSVKTHFLPEMWGPLWALDADWQRELDYHLTITSGKDGKHALYSGHYVGVCVDIRTWIDATSGIQLSGANRSKMLNVVKATLGKNWKVIDEANHFHLRYRPTYRG